MSFSSIIWFKVLVIACNALHGIGLCCLRDCFPVSHNISLDNLILQDWYLSGLGKFTFSVAAPVFGMRFPPSPRCYLLWYYLEGSWRPGSLPKPLAEKYEDPLACSCTVFHSRYLFILIGYFCIFLLLV